MLIKIIKHDFGLTIDIEELIRAIDTDGSGEIEFEEKKNGRSILIIKSIPYQVMNIWSKDSLLIYLL